MAINPKIMIVGIDIAKKKHWVRVLNFVGLEITKPFSFHNNKEDFIRTVVKLGKLMKEKDWRNYRGDGAYRALLERAGVVFEAEWDTGGNGKPFSATDPATQ